jgi:hypothetical protein
VIIHAPQIACFNGVLNRARPSHERRAPASHFFMFIPNEGKLLCQQTVTKTPPVIHTR